MAMDLRGFLDELRRVDPEDLVVVSKELDPRYEITALVVKLEREGRRPALLLNKVRGTSFRVLTNLNASRKRLALALQTQPRQMVGEYLKRLSEPLAPVRVADAPVKDVIYRGNQVNLLELPQIIHHEGDAGPYMTAAVAVARDPESGLVNASFNRLMIKSERHTGIHLTPGKHLWEFYKNAEARGQALQAALVLGLHPAWELGALRLGSIVEDEMTAMGSLAGEPLGVVRCETIDVYIPARAEMVLEGEIPPHQREEEGPLGEFTGYSLGTRRREIFNVKAITHRKDALFQDIAVGHLDHLLLSTIPIEANIFRAVQAMVPSVRAVRVPAPFTAYVSIEKRAEGQPTNAILSVLGSDMYIKTVVVVDHDVDVFSDREVTWALATRVQPDRDIIIIRNARGSDLDPSTLVDGVTSKVGIDATAYPSLERFAPRHRVPPDVLARLNLAELLE